MPEETDDPLQPPLEQPTLLGNLAPDEMFARGMQSVKMTSGTAGMWQPPTLEEAAQLFRGYEVIKLLGRGGMGAVYQARQIELDRLVAIKLLPLEISVDKDFTDRFRREARAMAKLNHPNIVSVYDFGATSEGHLYFVMEFVEGANLAEIIHQVGLDGEQALSVAEQVCAALSYAHDKGIVHRDIKPANVMIDTESHVKVADFGLARLMDSGAPDLGHTLTGTVMGTPDYMAPEQMRGMNVDHRADIYSVGVMVYEMLCREVPRGAFAPPSVRGGCDPRIDPIVIKAMQPDPERRFQSTREMKKEVSAARLSLPESAHAPLQAVLPPVAKKPSLGETPTEEAEGNSGRPAMGEQAQGGQSKVPLYAGLAVGVLIAAAATFLFFKPKPEAVTKAPVDAAQPPGASLDKPATQNAATPPQVVPAASFPSKTTPPAAALVDSGGTRSVVSPASASGERSAVAGVSDPGHPASLRPVTTPTPPADGQVLAVAATPQPEATSVPATPASTPVPSTPVASTPIPSTPTASATPKPATEVEKWFAQVDGPQQEAFQKQVLKPFEAGGADLRKHYLASLDAAIDRASTAGQLKEALTWRTERQAFEKAQDVVADDDTTPAGLKTLRATFRQQLARLEEDRTAKAKALLVSYDAVLAKNQTLLTQHKRLDDALLLQTKRDAIALAWLGTAQPATVVAAGQPESAKWGTALVATRDAPFVNTLGMKFVPVPIAGGPADQQPVLFGVWDVRVKDYAAYAAANPKVDGAWKTQNKDGVPAGRELNHPVVGVSWEDAQAFCQWLTEKETAEGKLPKGLKYRLPTDEEWSWAVGLPPELGTTPAEKNRKNSVDYPWGKGYPPQGKVGNYADESFHEKFPQKQSEKANRVENLWMEGYTDGYATTSPVGSFPANAYGLYDMGGNVWQWCEDWFDASHKDRVLRGASWGSYGSHDLLSSSRDLRPPGPRDHAYGFRCVVGVSAR